MSILKKSITVLLGALVVAGVTGCNDDKAKQAEVPAKQPVLQGDMEKFSYSVGVLMAQDMQRKGVSNLDEKALGTAIRDVIDGKPLQMSQEEMRAALDQQAQKLMAENAAKQSAKAAEAKAAGDKYRAENKAKEGVTTLPSGIQYKVLSEGSGDKPNADSTVVAHYKGSLIDGTVFDSSYERGSPATFALNRVVKGWQEVLPMMAVGAKWQVVIPPELAYGEAGAPPRIAGNETLLFDIELIDIKQPEAKK